MRLGRESQISSIIRVGILFLFGLTSVLSSADRLTCIPLGSVSAVPFFVRSLGARNLGLYPSWLWLTSQGERDAVITHPCCDKSITSQVRRMADGVRSLGCRGRHGAEVFA
jgi:hypothetical protein